MSEFYRAAIPSSYDPSSSREAISGVCRAASARVFSPSSSALFCFVTDASTPPSERERGGLLLQESVQLYDDFVGVLLDP